MGRSILAEEYIQTYVESVIHKNSWNFGVIIGQLTNQKDYVVHLARTPNEENTQGPQSLHDMDEIWVSKHVRQVENMLPGGLSVIGIFAIAKPDVLKSAQHKFRQILFATNKAQKKSSTQLTNEETQINDRIVLQICSVSRKLTCRTIDVSDTNSSERPAEWKYQSFIDRWVSLSCSVSINVQIPVAVSMGSKSLKKQIQNGLQGTCDNVKNSLALLNRQLFDDNEILYSKRRGEEEPHLRGSLEFCNRSHTSSVALNMKHYEVSLLNQMPSKEISEPTCSECCAQLLIRGTVMCQAYANNKATVRQAINTLKNDFVRTLMQRCELLCEDLLSTEEDQDPKIVYETPRRVFAVLPGSSIEMCDYVFIDEGTEESRSRFKELLDMEVDETDIDFECEKLPNEEDLVKPCYDSDISLSPSTVSSIAQFQTKPNMPFFGVVLAGVIAAVAVLFGLLYLNSLNTVNIRSNAQGV